VNVKVDDEMGDKLQTIAEVKGVTMTEVVRVAIQKEINDIWRDVSFQAEAKRMLERKMAGLGQ